MADTTLAGRPGRPAGEPQLLTLDETAQRLCTSTRFVRRLVAERRLGYTKIGKFVRFDRADVEDFIRRGRIDPVG